jgi:hypothetical protein
LRRTDHRQPDARIAPTESQQAALRFFKNLNHDRITRYTQLGDAFFDSGFDIRSSNFNSSWCGH